MNILQELFFLFWEIFFWKQEAARIFFYARIRNFAVYITILQYCVKVQYNVRTLYDYQPR